MVPQGSRFLVARSLFTEPAIAVLTVARSRRCIYDFVLGATPDGEKHIEDYRAVVASFRGGDDHRRPTVAGGGGRSGCSDRGDGSTPTST